MTDERRNKKVSSDRIIVENYFGRLRNYWMVLGTKFRWDEQNYDAILRICIAVKNLLVKFHPLRDKDGSAFERYKSAFTELETIQTPSGNEHRRNTVCVDVHVGSYRLAN